MVKHQSVVEECIKKQKQTNIHHSKTIMKLFVHPDHLGNKRNNVYRRTSMTKSHVLSALNEIN